MKRKNLFNFWSAGIILLICILFLSCKEKETQTPINKLGSNMPTVYSENPCVMLGDSFHAEIFLAGYPIFKEATITVDTINGVFSNLKLVTNKHGRSFYDTKPNTIGSNVFCGRITVKDPTRGWDTYFYRYSYFVFKPSAVVSTANTNVLYIGIPNPLEISAAGFSASDLVPKFIGSGTITGSQNNYFVNLDPAKVKPGDSASVSMTVKCKDGSLLKLGQPVKFKIKRIPDPVCYVNNKKGDFEISQNDIASLTGLDIKMEDFDYNVKYNVTYFEIIVMINGQGIEQASNSNKFTQTMKNMIVQASRGALVIIKNVHVTGPDKRVIPGVTMQKVN